MPRKRGRRIATIAIAAALVAGAGTAAAHERSAHPAFGHGGQAPAHGGPTGARAARSEPQTEPRTELQIEPRTESQTTPQAAPSISQTGRATYYGDAMQGRRTSSGERYDREALTAAHPSLPLGTLVEVTNLTNRRSITVRVNDRGPHSGGHLIDLSRAAASALGYVRQGIAKVRIVPLLRGGGAGRADTSGDAPGPGAAH